MDDAVNTSRVQISPNVEGREGGVALSDIESNPEVGHTVPPLSVETPSGNGKTR